MKKSSMRIDHNILGLILFYTNITNCSAFFLTLDWAMQSRWHHWLLCNNDVTALKHFWKQCFDKYLFTEIAALWSDSHQRTYKCSTNSTSWNLETWPQESMLHLHLVKELFSYTILIWSV